MTRRLTLTRMKDYLNNKHGHKSTGLKFSVSDVQGYIARGHLPFEYGGDNIILDDGLLESTGVKAYRLEKR